MAKFRLNMLPLNLLALINLMAWGASASDSSSSSPSSPSPSADVELICHTDNPAECYPKVFQPTDEFQIVRPDQDLPLGLHVRLNVYTGLKEAKINVPDENDPALEGLPVDSSVVVVEPDQAEDQIRIPPNAPAYDSAGKIKEPKAANPEEGSAFYKSLTILKKGLDVDGALEMLEDISHDIYYGLKIAEDYDTVHELFCLTTAAAPSDETALTRARLAALTLSSTVQNNPKALAEIERHWPKLAPSTCPGSTTTPLDNSIFTLIPPSSSITNLDPTLTKTRLALLTGLLKSPPLRTHFLTHSFSSDILRLLHSATPSDPEPWRAAHRRAAHLLLDTFLDADMGAAVGEWPVGGQQVPEGECAVLFSAEGESKGSNGQGREEECVDWIVGRVRVRFGKEKGHWSHELGEKIGEVRKKGGRKGDSKGRGGEKVDL